VLCDVGMPYLCMRSWRRPCWPRYWRRLCWGRKWGVWRPGTRPRYPRPAVFPAHEGEVHPVLASSRNEGRYICGFNRQVGGDCDVPALPGATYICSILRLCNSFQTMACSRAPLPMTNTFIIYPYLILSLKYPYLEGVSIKLIAC